MQCRWSRQVESSCTTRRTDRAQLWCSPMAGAATRGRVRTTGGLATAALAVDMGEREPAKAFLYAQISSFNRPIDLRTLLAREEPAGIDDLAVPVRMVVTDGDQLFPAAALRSV